MFFKNLLNFLKNLKTTVTFLLICSITLQISTQQVAINNSTPIQATCRYNYSSLNNNLYTCHLLILEPVTSANILEITGTHLDNHTDAHVEAVFQIVTAIEYFQGEVLRKFVNLKSIYMSDNALMDINSTAFDVCPKLESLSIISSQLTILPPGMLRNCENLIDLHISSYSVLSVPYNLFGVTKNLEVLQLQGNITSLPENLVQNMEKLRYLDISQNQLTQLGLRFLKNCPNLKTILAFSNNFEDDKSFMDVLIGQTNLETLWIYGNKFTNFDFNLLSEFQKLDELLIGSIIGPQLTNISWQSLPSSLTYLSVDAIGENIPEDAFSLLEGLDTLGIHGYGINVLHKDTFKPLLNLTALFIKGTNITSLPPDLFINQINLNQLEIRNTLVTRLNADTFGDNSKLQNIDFSFNKINEIQRGIFSKFNSYLTYVDLSENVCIDGYFYGENIDDDGRLNKCFTNWENVTTTTVQTPDPTTIQSTTVEPSTTPGGCGSNFKEFHIFTVIFISLVKVVMNFVGY